MTEQSNAELIAENRKWVRLHQANKYQAEAARRMTQVLDALEAAEKRAAEYAAVVEKVRERFMGPSMGLVRDVERTLTSAPANALRELKANVWDEGYKTSEQVWAETADLVTPDEDRTDPRNPYRTGATRG